MLKDRFRVYTHHHKQHRYRKMHVDGVSTNKDGKMTTDLSH